MASLNIQEIINKEVARRVEEQLELRKEEATAAARGSLKQIKELSNENKETENRIAHQLQELERDREAQLLLLDRKEKYLDDCSANLENRAEAIQRSVVDSSEEKMVTINMGGTVYTTLKSTLSSMSPVFANMFSDKWRDAGSSTIRDKDGNIFIDRDATYFPMLLNWARDGCDPEALKIIIKMVQPSLNKNNKHVYNICPKKYICKSFMKTLEYLCIDCLPEPPDEENKEHNLNVGQNVKLYWRGDRRMFEGWVIKRSMKGRGDHNLHTLLKAVTAFHQATVIQESTEVFVDILYSDGDIWRYKERSLMKEHGPFAKIKQIASKKHTNMTKYWHYGVEFGSRKIKGRKTSMAEAMDSSSDEEVN